MPLLTPEASRPVRITPQLSRIHSMVASQTGLLTGTSANVPVVTITNSSTLPITINSFRIQFITTTAFGAAQSVSFGAYVLRAITVVDSGGTSMTLTGNNNKLATGMTLLDSVVIRTATTGTLTAGTRTKDANALGIAAGWSGGVGETIAPVNLFSIDPGNLPVVLATGEGLSIYAIEAFGATGVGTLYWQADIQQ